MKTIIYSIALIFFLILQSCNFNKSIEGKWESEKPTGKDYETYIKIIKINEDIYKIEFWEDRIITNSMTVPFNKNELGDGFKYSPNEDKFYIPETDIVLIRKKEI